MGEDDFSRILSTEFNLMLLGTQVKVWEGEGQLDLLAIDREATVWVFEFKRDVAKPAAISQLLTYGSFAAGLSFEALKDIFCNDSPNRRDLATAFKGKFGVEMPKPSHKTRLVLAAFDFSTACLRSLDYLKHACGLHIGRLKMSWVVTPENVEAREFRYVEHPSVNMAFPGVAPQQFAMVFYEFFGDSEDWNLCRKSRLLILPEREDPDDPYVPGYDPDKQAPRSLPYHKLKRGMGLFVHLGVYDAKEDSDDPGEPGFDKEGLVGFGIIQDDPHEMNPDDFLKLRKALKWKGNNFEMKHKGNPWCVQVEWDMTLPMKKAIPPGFDIFNAPALALITDQAAKACFEALGLDSHVELIGRVDW